jgi:glycosyltransferase involved in cell wall biosynthesis
MPQLPQGWFSDADIQAYRKLVEQVPNESIIVELGVWKGRSLCSISDIIIRKKLKVIAIDTFEGSSNEPEHKKELEQMDLQKEFESNLSAYGIRSDVKVFKSDCNSLEVIQYCVGLAERFETEISLVFIDAEHTKEAVEKSISLWLPVTSTLAGHDYGDSWPGVKQAVDAAFPVIRHHAESYVWSYSKPTTSVIIPTWQGSVRCTPLLESIFKNSTEQYLENVEIIVVNNQPAKELILNFNSKYVRVITEHNKGFGHACNAGAAAATGNNLIFLNDDCVILEYAAKDEWIKRLVDPLNDIDTGMVGVLNNHMGGTKEFNFLVGFCVAIKKGIFSEYKFNIYEWGGAEDTELCFRVACAGYKIVNINHDNSYPIYHEAEGTLHDPDHIEQWQGRIYNQNFQKLMENLETTINIITPATRPENLYLLGESIHNAFDNFTFVTPRWIVVLNNGATLDEEDFVRTFPFATVLNYKESSPHGNAARRHGLTHVEQLERKNREYTYFQDDDNLFSIDVIKATFAHDTDVIFIKQLNIFNQLKAVPMVPFVQGEIDTAMIIAKHHIVYATGWQSDAYEADTEYARKLTRLEGMSGGSLRRAHTIALNHRLICSYNNIAFNVATAVTAVIPTKNRYTTTFPLTLAAVINQTVPPTEILIYDDSDEPVDIRELDSFKFLLTLANQKGIKWQLIYAPKMGVWMSHANSIHTASCPLIWRVDDDCIPQETVLEKLLAHMTSDVSAVAGSILMVDQNIPHCPDNFTNKLGLIHITPNAQWFKRNNVIEAEHLYSSFLYRKIHALGFEFPPLSRVSFREETMLSLYLGKKGKLLLIPDCITWHSMAQGGVRSEGNKKEMFDADEVEFRRFLKMHGFKEPKGKIFYAANGKGDAEILRRVAIEFEQEGGTALICSADNNVDVFEEDFIVLNTYDSFVMGFGKVTDWNIYNFLHSRNWKKSLYEAYKTFFV